MKYTLEERRKRDREYYHKTREQRLNLNKKRYKENKQWFFDNNKKYVLKKKYKLSLEEYQRMFDLQEGLCFLCKQKGEDNRLLCIDHNHNNGKIRSLLCGSCNRGLGLFKDNPNLLERAAEYIRAHGEQD